jgi:hypothetical protein
MLRHNPSILGRDGAPPPDLLTLQSGHIFGKERADES